MSFTSWLRKQHRRHDLVGDLARDCRDDETWPKRKRSLRAFRDYLDCRACDGALDALDLAWEEWEILR